MKLAFVVPRYGPDVVGGAEHFCRLVAERLASRHEVDVLTTCARNSSTWENVYAEGTDRIRGVNIRRFANAAQRDLDAFNEYSSWIVSHPHTRAEELKWLQLQGPWSPALVEWLRRTHQQYDVLTFFTYIHAPTVLGLDVNPGKSVVVPLAKSAPLAQFEIFKDVFKRPAALCYLTESERLSIQGRFRDRPLIEDVVGVGVEIPHHGQSEADAPGDSPSRVEGDSPRPEWLNAMDDAAPSSETREYLIAKGATFRRRHRLHGPIALYGGRIDPGTGCEELIEYFSSYRADGGDATLALMGAKMMALPEEPWIRFAGLLSDSERLQALEAATVVVCPSPEDTLSMLALEAMAMGTPVLANASNAAIVEHCRKSNSGLYYAGRDEFVECLKLLMEDGDLRDQLGRNGRDYVRTNLRWDLVVARLERVFGQVKNAR